MIGLKKFRIALLALATVLALTLFAGAAPLTIGITQIVEHPALDAARQGFIDRMTELGYTDATYDIQSAQGDQGTAITIAQKFQADGVDIVLAIATPAAQAAAQVIRDIPILITAVTDPVEAELVDSIERPGTNVTGTSDLTPVKSQLELLQELVPTARRVGVIYNAGEVNSVVQVDIAKAAAKELGLTIVEATATNSGEVFQAAQSLVGRVDALYVPTDNTAVSAIESVIIVAEQAKLPLITGEDLSVESGALATVGLDYYVLGRQTADIAHRVLQGADPAETPIEYLDDMNIVINLGAAKRMGVTVSDDLLKQASQIFEN